jgi:hypothetical protein
MPWHCPACSTVIRHSDVEERPVARERYRCHVCRLSLNFDEQLSKLVIEEFESDHYVQPDEPKRPNTFPSTVPNRGKTRRKSSVA